MRRAWQLVPPTKFRRRKNDGWTRTLLEGSSEWGLFWRIHTGPIHPHERDPVCGVRARKRAEYHAEKGAVCTFRGEAAYAMTATVVRVKSKFTSRYRSPNSVEDDFFVQIVRDGKPCGVWAAVLK